MVHGYFHKHKQASILGSCRSYFTLLIRHLLLCEHTHTCLQSAEELRMHTEMQVITGKPKYAHTYINTRTCIFTQVSPTNTHRHMEIPSIF